jgi:hypothetical protein
MCSLHPARRTQGARRRGRQWFRAVGHGILLTLLAQPLRAADGIAINNDSTYAPQPRLQVDLDDGSTCSVTDRSPPSLVVYGRWREGEEQAGNGLTFPENMNRSVGMGGGVALLVPLGGTGFKNTCSGLLQMQLNRAKLALAQQLLEAGHISDDDMKQVVGGMRRSLGLH